MPTDWKPFLRLVSDFISGLFLLLVLQCLSDSLIFPVLRRPTSLLCGSFRDSFDARLVSAACFETLYELALQLALFEAHFSCLLCGYPTSLLCGSFLTCLMQGSFLLLGWWCLMILLSNTSWTHLTVGMLLAMRRVVDSFI